MMALDDAVAALAASVRSSLAVERAMADELVGALARSRRRIDELERKLVRLEARR